MGSKVENMGILAVGLLAESLLEIVPARLKLSILLLIKLLLLLFFFLIDHYQSSPPLCFSTHCLLPPLGFSPGHWQRKLGLEAAWWGVPLRAVVDSPVTLSMMVVSSGNSTSTTKGGEGKAGCSCGKRND